MSVLIKGIGIPNSCAECRFCVNGFSNEAPVYECACESYENMSVLVDDHGKPFDFRPEWCSLVEVPTPHGRLGDLDKLKSKFRHGEGDSDVDSAWISTIRRFITQANTIIEAEESE